MSCGLWRIAAEIAKYSTASNYKLGCIITDKRGRILSSGVNKPTKSHPKQARYAKQAGESKKIYLHAEIGALVNLRDSSSVAYHMYVVRITRTGRLAPSKPCPICELAIKESGIKRITYVNQAGKIETKRLS